MSERESLAVKIVYAVSGALKPVLGEGEFETVPDGRERVLEVSTDDWTMHIEWERGIAWLAIDDEPNDPAEFEQARRSVMSEAVVQAWGLVNIELSGFLADALTRSHDAFSIAFARAISILPPDGE